MKAAEKRALARMFFEFGNGGGPIPPFVQKLFDDKLAKLEDEPEPTMPGAPRALELAKTLEEGLWLSKEELRALVFEACAILRRAPGPDLDQREADMRAAGEAVLSYLCDTDEESHAENALESAIAAMRAGK